MYSKPSSSKLFTYRPIAHPASYKPLLRAFLMLLRKTIHFGITTDQVPSLPVQLWSLRKCSSSDAMACILLSCQVVRQWIRTEPVFWPVDSRSFLSPFSLWLSRARLFRLPLACSSLLLSFPSTVVSDTCSSNSISSLYERLFFTYLHKWHAPAFAAFAPLILFLIKNCISCNTGLDKNGHALIDWSCFILYLDW